MAGVMFEERPTKISIAVKSNNVQELRNALKHDEDPHHRDRKGNTYLHYVCTMHRPCIFHILVTAGINVNAQNRHGNTALHVTALHNDCSHVGDLLAAGIDPTIRNKMGKTAAEIETKNKFWKTIYDKYQGSQTLRHFAASRKFHDLVFHIDKHKHTMGAIYAILEGDTEKAAQFLRHSKCNVNLLNHASETSHILQHAVKSKDVRQVRMICRAKANLNIRVTLDCYLKAPLFFSAFHPEVPADIMWIILRHGPDFKLKDERGRNAAIYALDKTDRKIPCEVIAFMMSEGLDVSQRDETGVTLRDVARFARRKDILELVDKAYVKIIRTSDLKELRRLCIMGYDGMFIQFNHRDTFIFASGNETEDALNFIQKLPELRSQIRQFHHGIRQWSRDKIIGLLTSSKWSDILINARDKGGRTSLHLAILHWRMDLLRLFLSWDNIEINAVTNVGRSTYHYASCVEEEAERGQFCRILEEAKQDVTCRDYKGLLPEELLGKEESTQWIQQERKMRYGMEKQLQCVDKYEELCHMMKYKGKNLVHFEKSVCRFRYPVAEFHKILSPLMPEYRDLIFVAMEKKKEDIATRLIQLGTDWKLLDWVNAEGEVSRNEKNGACTKLRRKRSKDTGNNIKKIGKEDEHNPKEDIDKNVDQEINAALGDNNEDKIHLKYSHTMVPCQVDISSTDQDKDSKGVPGMRHNEEVTELEQITVEKRAYRLGMFKVLSAIEKKKAFEEKKQKEYAEMSKGDDCIDDSRNSPNEVKGSIEGVDFKGSCVNNILSPIRKLPNSKIAFNSHNEKLKDPSDGAETTFTNDVHFTVESLQYDSDSNDEFDDDRDNNSIVDENSDQKADYDYSDDEFFSDENSISDFDDSNG